jgi:2'-5' RNA ligase
VRAFVAIQLPEVLQSEMARRVGRARSRLPAARWVRPENCHITLFFLGEVSEGKAEQIHRRLGPVFSCRSPFEIQLADGGTFPPGRPARVAWVGIRDGGKLGALQAAVSEACGEVVGGKEPRSFHPHVTAARCRRPWRKIDADAWKRALAGELGAPFQATEGVLMRSLLERTGARYDVVSRYPLARE